MPSRTAARRRPNDGGTVPVASGRRHRRTARFAGRRALSPGVPAPKTRSGAAPGAPSASAATTGIGVVVFRARPPNDIRMKKNTDVTSTPNRREDHTPEQINGDAQFSCQFYPAVDLRDALEPAVRRHAKRGESLREPDDLPPPRRRHAAARASRFIDCIARTPLAHPQPLPPLQRNGPASWPVRPISHRSPTAPVCRKKS